MQQATSVIVLGIVDSAVLAVAAVGFSLQFGVTNYFNFGYGEWLTFGAYIAWMVNAQWLQLNIWLAVVLAGLATAALSLLMNRAVFSPFTNRRRDPFFILIVTFAIGFLLNQAFIVVWGTDFRELNASPPSQISLGFAQISSDQLIFLVIAVACMVAIQLIFSRTRIGKSMRAVADNRRLAEVCGLRTRRIIDVTWMITGFLAGVAGVMLALQTRTFGPDMGDNYVYLIFPAVIIGGIGRSGGAVAGAVLIGIFAALGSLLIPASVSTVLIFVALVAAVLLRPQGLLGGGRRPSMQEA